MGKSFNFNKDLQQGKEAENRFIKHLKKNYFRRASITPAPEKAFKDWDVKVELTFEVKWDMKAKKTGNFAFEYFSYGKPSGFMATKASFWVHCYSDLFYIFPTKDLKKQLTTNEYKTIEGGQGKTRMFLVPIDEIITWPFLRIMGH